MRLFALGSTVVVLGLLLAMGLDLVVEGAGGLYAGYATDAVRDGGRAGGIGPILVSTLCIVLLATAIALPFGLAGAILVSDVLFRRPAWARAARRSFDVMISVPSVAVGLAGWSLFAEAFDLGFSLLAGSLTLALMLVPLMAASFLAGLDAVPRALRAESHALGVSRWRTLWSLVLPAARPALFAGIALAVGRATAETAALVLTSGISSRLPESLFDPGASLAVHVYHLARDVPGGEPRAYTAALALLLINVGVHAFLSRMRTAGTRTGSA